MASGESTESETASDATGGVQSVERALVILDILARSGEAGVTTIAQELGVHKSTAQRLVATLEQGGVVEQTSERGKYRLGMGVLRLAAATAARLDVVAETRPICRQLALDTGETVNVAVLSEGAALYVDQVAGSATLQVHNWVGQRIPLHATSNGKVLISELPAGEVERMVRELRAYTQNTLTSRKKLRDELAAVRDNGWAVAVDELETGLTAVAVPVRNAHGDIVASLSVSGPTFRLDQSRVDAIVPVLRRAGDEASHRLGWG
ncbi:IclR family transcriptional regulator [Jatrophihabitans fulvus]